MAGGNPYTKNPQQKGLVSQLFNNSEILNDSQPSKPKTSILEGVLFFNGSQEQKKPESIETPKVNNQLQREITILASQDREQDKKDIEKLQQEIKLLAPKTENPNSNISNIPLERIPEANNYQSGRLGRVLRLLQIDASNSNSGAEIYDYRSKRRFNSRAKSGGQKYRDSGEHAVARSAN